MKRNQKLYIALCILVVATALPCCVPSQDLVLTGPLIIEPATPAVGDKINIKQTWVNAGTKPISSEFDISLAIKQENRLVFDQYLRVEQPVAPGEEYTIDITPDYVFPELGTYQIILTLDANGVIAESRELNNVTESKNIVVSSFSKKADLQTVTQARKDIEKYRKGDVTLTIIDAAGHPVSGLEVEYTQIAHSFLFGIFCTSKEEQIWSLLKQAGLNYAPVWLGWNSLEPEFGIYTLDTERVYFLRQFDFEGMGHALIFLSNEAPFPIPQYVYAMSYDDYKKAVYNHIYKIANEYKDDFHIWNVFNEPMLAHTNALGLNEEQTLEVTREGIRAIRDVDNDAQILINNYNPGGESPGVHPYVFMQYAIQNNVDFDIIGLEFYYNAYNRTPLKMHVRRSLSSMGELVDQYATLGKKLHISEISVPSVHNEGMNGYWGTYWNEELQAEYLEAAYTIFFSKPQVEAISWWDATDKDSFIFHGGLFDEQHRPKKSYYALKDLIKGWTTSGMGITGQTGQISFRGFGGQYEVKVVNPDTGMSKLKEITIEEQKENLITIVFD